MNKENTEKNQAPIEHGLLALEKGGVPLVELKKTMRQEMSVVPLRAT